MRVLLLSTYFKPDIASTGVLMTGLAEELTRLGHQVSVVTSMPHYDGNRIWPNYRGKLHLREQVNGLDVHRIYLYVPQHKQSLVGRMMNYATFNVLSVVAGVLQEPFDVVLCPSPPLTNGLAAFMIGRLRGVPYVYNVQDIYPDVAVRLGVLTNPRAITFLRAMERFVYRHAAAVSVISEGFKRNLMDKGVPGDKVEVIPNFMDTEFIRPLARASGFSAAQDLDDKFVVLFAGNIGLSQGLDTVLDAASALRGYSGILFLIVGDGSARPDLEAYARTLGLRNTRFLPFQPHETLPELYATADVCLVPLRKGVTAESVPCKVFTITAAGRPLIAAVDGGSDTDQFVQEADCGLWVEPEDAGALAGAILMLYEDPDRRDRLGRSGRAYVESRYTPRIVARRYATLLERVVSA